MSNQMSGTEAARRQAEQEVFDNLLACFSDATLGDVTPEQEEGLREAARLVFSGLDAEDAIAGGWDPGEMSIERWLTLPDQQVYSNLLTLFGDVTADDATPEQKEGLRHAAKLMVSGLDGDAVEDALNAGWQPDEMTVLEWLEATPEVTRGARPRRPTPEELAKVGVDLVDSRNLTLRCQNCGTTWSPNLLAGGRLPARWWQCPKACNAGIREEKSGLS